MTQAKCSEKEFIDLFNSTGGALTEMAKILDASLRNIGRRRRNIEERTGHPLLSTSPLSNDSDIVLAEYPDWQQIEIKNGMLIVISDAHLVPGHKSAAHRAALKFISEFKPKAVIDNGDLLDFSSIARHHRIGWDKQFSVKRELEWAGDCLEEIARLCKGAVKKRTMGNHDQRYSGFISNTRPELEGVKGMSLQDHIVGWPVSWAIRVNDELEVKHRWKSGLHGPFNNTLWSGLSYATGHQHKQQIYPLTDLRGDRWGVDVGTLASIYGPHFRYKEAEPRNWRSGFGIFRFVDYKLRCPELVRVIDEKNGLCEFRGLDFTV